MHQSARRARLGHRREIMVSFGVAVALACSIAACGSTDDARTQLEGRLRKATNATKDGVPRYVRELQDNAVCLSGEVTDRIGSDDVRALIDARGDLSEMTDSLSANLTELRGAVHSCVDVRSTLVDSFETAGMTNAQANCVADRALEDDKILTPLLVNIIFGDPGVGTAVFVAARATRGCLSADDLARLFPGRRNE